MILYIAREIRILMDLQENSRLFHNANEDYYNYNVHLLPREGSSFMSQV
jgi:hypothetical protein